MSFSKMKVAELRKLCDDNDLENKGTKQVLIDRLEAAGVGGEGGKKSKAKAKGKGKRKEEAEPEDAKTVLQKKAKEEAKSKKKKKGKSRKPDPASGADEILEDYQATLNQTNVGNNNNKFYIVEVHVLPGGSYQCWTHWGRVGENGQNGRHVGSKDSAIAMFEKKFKDKTGNKWADRAKFVPKNGKYTLIEVEAEEDDEMEAKLDALAQDQAKSNVPQKYAPSKLPKKTQDLVSLIFDHDMFKSQMQSLNIDTEKMPLGKLSAAQILKGYETLEELEKAVENGDRRKVEQLTGQFYTQIPHAFGRTRPPLLDSQELVQGKYDMLNILGDIASAKKAEDEAKKKQQSKKVEVKPNPLDISFETLDCDLTPLDPNSKEYKLIKKYVDNTNSGGWRKATIIDVFEVDRHSAAKRFAANKGTGNRKLLWHGTNVAVVSAILKSGLRIMPHSGGRVGRGIYCASENSKSSGYVGCTGNNVGIMFLNEVVLGKEYHVEVNHSQLKAAPAKHDSVVAQGQTEPDPKDDTTIKFDGNDVVVPCGKPQTRKKYQQSHFSQSEYLVYKESQCRIRYLLKMKFN